MLAACLFYASMRKWNFKITLSNVVAGNSIQYLNMLHNVTEKESILNCFSQLNGRYVVDFDVFLLFT